MRGSSGRIKRRQFVLLSKAHMRRILRIRWRQGCDCSSSPLEGIAPLPTRLFDNTLSGSSVWPRVLFEPCACLRPLSRVAAGMGDQGLPSSPGPLGCQHQALRAAVRSARPRTRRRCETGWGCRSTAATAGRAAPSGGARLARLGSLASSHPRAGPRAQRVRSVTRPAPGGLRPLQRLQEAGVRTRRPGPLCWGWVCQGCVCVQSGGSQI